jgi:hypothetical protein
MEFTKTEFVFRNASSISLTALKNMASKSWGKITHEGWIKARNNLKTTDKKGGTIETVPQPTT